MKSIEVTYIDSENYAMDLKHKGQMLVHHVEKKHITIVILVHCNMVDSVAQVAENHQNQCKYNKHTVSKHLQTLNPFSNAVKQIIVHDLLLVYPLPRNREFSENLPQPIIL